MAVDEKSYSFEMRIRWIEASVWGVKTAGRGFVLTRFLFPFHRLEKERPIRPEDKKNNQNKSLLRLLLKKMK